MIVPLAYLAGFLVVLMFILFPKLVWILLLIVFCVVGYKSIDTLSTMPLRMRKRYINDPD